MLEDNCKRYGIPRGKSQTQSSLLCWRSFNNPPILKITRLLQRKALVLGMTVCAQLPSSEGETWHRLFALMNKTATAAAGPRVEGGRWEQTQGASGWSTISAPARLPGPGNSKPARPWGVGGGSPIQRTVAPAGSRVTHGQEGMPFPLAAPRQARGLL